MRKKGTVVCMGTCYGITVEPLECGLAFVWFSQKGKLQGTPELWMWTHRSPSTWSLLFFYIFSCFTVYFMALVVLNCWYLLGVLQMKNWWWGQQRSICTEQEMWKPAQGTDWQQPWLWHQVEHGKRQNIWGEMGGGGVITEVLFSHYETKFPNNLSGSIF